MICIHAGLRRKTVHKDKYSGQTDRGHVSVPCAAKAEWVYHQIHSGCPGSESGPGTQKPHPYCSAIGWGNFTARELSGRQYYIQVSYTIQDAVTKEREISAFHLLDDGYKKILITMDRNPLTNLGNGYVMMHLFDFLLNENALETA